MFERYTERARRAIFFARYEGSQFGSATIETEHLLLGLIREDENLATRFICSASSVDDIRNEIKGRTTVREKVSTAIDLPLSSECKRILAYAAEESERLNHRHIGTEHLLLGVLREEKCLAAEILRERGIKDTALREELSSSAPAEETQRLPGTGPRAVIDQILNDPKRYSNLLKTLATHGFIESKSRLSKAESAGELKDWATARTELQFFLETLTDAIIERLKGDDRPLFAMKGFDWPTFKSFASFQLNGLQWGMTEPADWGFRWRLTLVLAENLLKRFEQRLNSAPGESCS